VSGNAGKYELRRGSKAGELHWSGSLQDQYSGEDGEWRVKALRHSRVRTHVDRLSRQPVRRLQQIWFLKRKIDPFSGVALVHAAIEEGSVLQWLMLMHALQYNMLSAECIPALRIMAMSGNTEGNYAALYALTSLLGSEIEPILMAKMEQGAKSQESVMTLVRQYGSAELVPAVAEYVHRRVMRKSRLVDNGETPLFDACVFLEQYIDESDLVEPALARVVERFFHLDWIEANRIAAVVRWIGVRVPQEKRVPEEGVRDVTARESDMCYCRAFDRVHKRFV
jgi:hypothetical protein